MATEDGGDEPGPAPAPAPRGPELAHVGYAAAGFAAALVLVAAGARLRAPKPPPVLTVSHRRPKALRPDRAG